MSKLQTVGQVVQAAASRLGGKSHPAMVSREMTREDKVQFLEVCRSVCPNFQITEGMKPLLNDILRWCIGIEGPYDPQKGLWLCGTIGTGKSTMLQIVREFCRLVRPAVSYRETDGSLTKEPWEYGFRISNMSFVAGVYAKEGYPGIDEYIVNCRQAFDEVGRECIPAGYFGNMENVFRYIIQRRYDLRRGDFTHVTSNLKPEQIGEVYGDHIYDRCIEMFNFVEMTGKSWRGK